MSKNDQVNKAKKLLQLHLDDKLLILPNIWDPIGAIILDQLGFAAVATASASIAYSNGIDDGQKIEFGTMLNRIEQIAEAVAIPVTADIERGYADDSKQIAENVEKVINTGAVGINIENSFNTQGPLCGIDEQCTKISEIRKAADRIGVPLVINARTDVFLNKLYNDLNKSLEETIKRGKAYLEAGANCFYPIVVPDLDIIKTIRKEIKEPINIYMIPGLLLKELEDIGINRVSFGPSLFKKYIAVFKEALTDIQNYNTDVLFSEPFIKSEDLQEYIG